MFDRLEDTLVRFEELLSMLSEPDVANDPKRFQKLMKEQADLAPIVEAYKEYKENKQNIEDSLAMLQEESDEELRELAKEELAESKEKVEELYKLQHSYNYVIEVDGGINNETIKKIKDANISVVGSYITNGEYESKINSLKEGEK